ncbi:MAG: hypothetical protein CMH13_09465 [Martelella sp.]|uniref:glycosyltransferase family 4 protein n=1 Tax=unclassified Martelella TaxID=2629616 RepID=UPI000C6A7DD6|nr:glycosyltransferase family 4 protein [Martelella sp.]MAU20748.1 hypothetical protein [Martelella sp.]
MRPDTDSIIVVHNGRRDNYQVAKAFSEKGFEVHLVTDFYYQPKSPFSFLVKLAFGNMVRKRYDPEMSVVVHSSFGLIVTDYLEKFFPRNEIVNRMRSHLLGKKAAKTIERTGAKRAIFYYNCGINSLPGHIRRKCSITLFQMHPHPHAIREIYDSYLEFRPQLSETLFRQEEEMTDNESYFKGLLEEALRSDKVICTSTFSKQTLISAGVDSEKIYKVPYGFPETSETIPSTEIATNALYSLRLAFVGQFVVRKGVFELLTVVADRPEIELTIYTREARFASDTVKRWLGSIPKNILFKTVLDDKALWLDAQQRDFLILPSLVEGFGLVITEAMANGLPVICSPNTVGPDIIRDGVSGYLTKGHLARDIEHACDRAIEQKGSWPSIRKNAMEVARDRTWTEFRSDIRDIV